MENNELEMNKLALKNNKKELKILIKTIRRFNKEVKGQKFDYQSFKNNIHNLKITRNIKYIENFLNQSCNKESIDEIVSLHYEFSKQHSSEFIIHLKSFINDLDKLKMNEINNRLLKTNKLYKLVIYRFNKNIDYVAPISRFKDKENAKNYLESIIGNLEKFLDFKFDKTESIIYLKSQIVEICRDIYPETTKKETKFNQSKVYKFFEKKWNSKFRKLKPVVAPEKIRFKDFFKKENWNAPTIKTYLFGSDEQKGVLTTFCIYLFLILFGFVYLYPILYMLGKSFMSVEDLTNPYVNYVPTQLDYGNYNDAFVTLNYWQNLGNTLLVSVIPALAQTVSCALVAWGLARYNFKGKKILLGLIIFTFLIPSCLVVFPTLSLFRELNLTGNVFAYILPALFGQGIKSAVFILIFYQYFKSLPQAIVEAAKIDGANDFVIFIRIGIPAAKSAVLLSILLSIVWYYNETFLAALYFGSNIKTLPLELQNFQAAFNEMVGGTGDDKALNEAVYLAGTMLNILPLLIFYFFTQRHFIQAVDKAGITGE